MNPTESFFQRLGQQVNMPRWALVGLLALLHLALMLDIQTPSGRAVLVAHFGAFLLWQPFFRHSPVLRLPHVLLFAGLLVLALIWLSWWAVTLWLILLAGIIGGRVFVRVKKYRPLFYQCAFGYLIAALFIIAVPHSLSGTIAHQSILPLVSFYLLPLALVVMALLPVADEADDEVRLFDFISSALIILGLAAMVFGTIAQMLLRNYGYVEALLEIVMTIACMLLALGLVWAPRAGFSGIGILISRYLLTSALPFERWLSALTELTAQEPEPESFMRAACENLLRLLPWASGCQWQTDALTAQAGECAGVATRFERGGLILTLYSPREIPIALRWHIQLVVHLLEVFRQDKLRARQLSQMSYLSAIHETGARLTHDMKNLLQSLNTLCSAAGREGEVLSPQYQALLRRQLPAVSLRLQQTLDKLRKPEQAQPEWVDAGGWWERICRTYENQGIVLRAETGGEAATIPAHVFSSALENLLQNALEKRQAEPALQIEVVLTQHEGHPVLQVSDSGSSIPAAIAAQLGRKVARSASGYGVGLYQVEQLARSAGYVLRLADNCAGHVCFRLEVVTIRD